MLKPLLRTLLASTALVLATAGVSGAVDVASVNGDIISMEELNQAVQSLPEYQKMQQEVLKRLVLNKLYLQASEKAGIKVADTEIEDSYARLRANISGGEEAFSKLLKERGTSEKELKAGIRSQLAVNAYLKSLDDKADINVTDEEIKLFYEEQPSLFSKPEKVRVSHIQVVVATDAPKAEIDAQLARIQAIEKELKSGKDFAEIAKEKSDATDKEKGGDVGYITRESPVAKSLLDAAFALKKGERSGIIRSLDGFHILEVSDRISAMTLPFEDVKESIKTNIVRERVSNNRMLIEKQMADKAEIKMLIK